MDNIPVRIEELRALNKMVVLDQMAIRGKDATPLLWGHASAETFSRFAGPSIEKIPAIRLMRSGEQILIEQNAAAASLFNASSAHGTAFMRRAKIFADKENIYIMTKGKPTLFNRSPVRVYRANKVLAKLYKMETSEFA